MKRAGTRVSQLQLLLMGIIVSLGGMLRVANLGNVAARTPDERVYTQQANVWLQSGRPGLHSLVETYKRDSLARYYPMPTRAGMIRLVAATMKWTGRYDDSVGAIVSCAASIFSLYVLALIGLRFLPPWAALAGLVLYSVFPPSLAIARRTWTDAIVELTGLLLVWFACEIARNSSRRVWYLLFAIVGSASITVKESMPVPFATCGALILWFLLKERREWKNGLVLILITAAGLMTSIWWLSRMTGRFEDLVQIVTGIQGVNATNPYAIEYASGPGYMLLDAFWIVSPISAILGLAGLFVAFKRPAQLGTISQPILWIAIFALFNCSLAMIIPHWLNLRYVSVAFGPICLLAGVGAWYLYESVSSRVPLGRRGVVAGIATVIVVAGAVTDYRRFQRVFVRDATADLSIKMLQTERHR